MTCTGNQACAMKSVTFSLLVLLNVMQSSFFECTIYIDYVMDIIFLQPEKSESRYVCKRRNLTLEPTTGGTDIEIAIYTVLKTAQCLETSYNSL